MRDQSVARLDGLAPIEAKTKEIQHLVVNRFLLDKVVEASEAVSSQLRSAT